MGLTDNIRFYAATDVGRLRDHNDDNNHVDKKHSLILVADGMGGHAAGEVASALAVRIMHEELKKEAAAIEEAAPMMRGTKQILVLLEQAVQKACARIHEEARLDAEKRGMGTTLALLGAYVLAGELSRHDDHRAAFAAYEAAMRPYVRKAQKLPPGTPRVANPRSRGGMRLLTAAVRLAATPAVSRVTGSLGALSGGGVDVPDYAIGA